MPLEPAKTVMVSALALNRDGDLEPALYSHVNRFSLGWTCQHQQGRRADRLEKIYARRNELEGNEENVWEVTWGTKVVLRGLFWRRLGGIC